MPMLAAGDLVLIPFPYTDQSSRKRRPALVITPTRYNRTHADAIFAFVTSIPQAPDEPFAVPLLADRLASGRLLRDSWARIDKLFTLEQRLVTKTVAKVPPRSMQEVRHRIIQLLAED